MRKGSCAYFGGGPKLECYGTASSGHFDRFSENAFSPVYAWCGCNLSVEQILRSLNSISLFTKTVLLEGKGKNWTQNWEKFHICIAANKTHSESSVAVHLPHAMLLHLKQSLLVLL